MPNFLAQRIHLISKFPQIVNMQKLFRGKAKPRPKRP